MTPTIQVTRSGAVFAGTPLDTEGLRRRFDREHYLLFQDFLHPEVLSLIRPFLESAEFSAANYRHIGSELLMEPNLGFHTLSFLINDKKLLSLVEVVTGCGPIGGFAGRVYKLIPHPQHHFDWHDDLREADRLVAMSINLTERAFQGGVLQLRRVGSEEIAGQVCNSGFGNAVLFRVSKDFEHRVTPIVGDTPRMSFAGWFKSGPQLPCRPSQVQVESLDGSVTALGRT